MKTIRFIVTILVSIIAFISTKPYWSSAQGDETLTLTPTSIPEEKILHVYNWEGAFDDETIQEIKKEFKKDFGVTVEYETYRSNEELLDTLQAETAAFDVIFPQDYMVRVMIQSNLLKELDKNEISNFDVNDLDERFRNRPYDPNHTYSIPQSWDVIGIAYREDEAVEPVDSWGALFNPASAGHIFMPDSMCASIGSFLLYVNYSYNSANHDKLEEAKNFLISKQSLLYADGDYTRLSFFFDSGDISVALTSSKDVRRLSETNPNIKFVIPKEGAAIWITNAAIPKNAQHKELSYTFINFLLELERAAEIHSSLYLPSPYNTVERHYTEQMKTAMSELARQMKDKKIEFQADLSEQAAKVSEFLREISETRATQGTQ